MRTLQIGLRVSDRSASIAFYTTLGYEMVGEVPQTPIGHLTMLKLPDDDFVTLELVHDAPGPFDGGSGVSHIAVQVASIDDVVRHVRGDGVEVGPVTSPQPEMFTAELTDPDGYTIELVQWPPDHPAGMTADDLSRDEED